MNMPVEPTNIGLSEGAHNKLRRLQDEGHFSQMADAYRFAIALALSNDVRPIELSGPRSNIFGVATIDPEREIYTAIKSLIDTGDTPVYRWAERLADWGVQEMASKLEDGQLDLGIILTDALEKTA